MDAGRQGVVVVGDVMADVVADLGGPLRRGTDTPASVRLLPGGSAANTAAWLASLDVAVTLVGAVGDDDLGRAQLEDLSSRGVATAVDVVAGAATGTVVALVDGEGERTFATDRGANGRLTFGPRAEAAVARHRHLHLSGYALFDPGSRTAALAALAAARAGGMSISVDPGSVAPLERLGPHRWREWTAGAEVCFANAEEAEVLGDGLADVYAQLVVKLGPAGCRWTSGDRHIEVPAVPVAVVDTVGAGDALAAGWLAAWLGGAAPDAALRQGVAAGGRAVGTAGGRPPPPARSVTSGAPRGPVRPDVR